MPKAFSSILALLLIRTLILIQPSRRDFSFDPSTNWFCDLGKSVNWQGLQLPHLLNTINVCIVLYILLGSFINILVELKVQNTVTHLGPVLCIRGTNNWNKCCCCCIAYSWGELRWYTCRKLNSILWIEFFRGRMGVVYSLEVQRELCERENPPFNRFLEEDMSPPIRMEAVLWQGFVFAVPFFISALSTVPGR